MDLEDRGLMTEAGRQAFEKAFDYEIIPPNSEIKRKPNSDGLGCINKTMGTPFTYGKIATDKNFINREVETTNLVWNFVSLSNTIIIAPRGWGGTLVIHELLQHPDGSIGSKWMKEIVPYYHSDYIH